MLTILDLLLSTTIQPPRLEENRPLTFKQRMIFYEAFDDKRRPSLAAVLGAEKVLSRNRCIGQMRRWRRTFSFGRDPDTLRLDTTRIDFTFIQAGHAGKPAGRRITTLSGAIDGPDDRQFLMADGVYSTRSHLATIAYCGFNHPVE